MANFVIKRLSTEYSGKISKIIFEILENDFPEYEPRVSLIYRTKIFTKHFFKKLIEKRKNAIFGVFIEKELVAVTVVKSDWGGVAFIEWLAVKKQYRNMGIGKALLEKAESWALKTYHHYIYLYTESDKNIKYYKRRGFEYMGIQKNVWFGANEHLLQKSLKEKPFEEMFNRYLKNK